jgi:dihydroxyacetone kinase DhaKLM complex PTS-EIIA-like component DhaM
MSPVHAQEALEKAYKKGTDAAKDRKWDDVIAAMREAIAIDPMESTRERKIAFVKIGGSDYMPHFLMARAFYSKNDCTAALKEWELSDAQGVSRKNADYIREIERGYKDCSSKGFLPSPRFNQELDETRAAIRAAADEARQLGDHVASYGDSVKALHKKSVAGAEARLQTANEKLKSGEQTRKASDLVEARAAATAASAELKTARATVDIQIGRDATIAQRIKSIEAELAQVEAVGRDIDAAARAGLTGAVTGPAAASRGKAEALVATARERIRNATRTQGDSDITEASKAVGDSGSAMKQARLDVDALIKASAERELATVQAAGGAAFSTLSSRVALVEDAFRRQTPSPQIGTDFERLQKSISGARQAFERAVKARDVAAARVAADQPRKFSERLDVLTKDLALQAPVLPGSLKAAAQALFDGRYAEALKQLSADEAGGIETPFKVHAYVVRAAALYALFQYSGGRDDSLRTQARQAADDALRLVPDFQPNPAAFSPRFVAFFREGASAAP